MKKVLITGVGSGIGRATVKKFIENGYFVIGQYNTNKVGVESLVNELEESNCADRFFSVQANFSNGLEIYKMMDAVEKSFKSIDVLVNNSGVGLYKLITDTTEDEWDKVFSVNMKSAYLVTNRVLKSMISNQKGKIINISSMWGQVGASMEVAYSASKAAVIGYTKALAKEVAPSGINVNCICPGVIDTPMNARFSKEDIEDLKEQTPLGRIGTPEEVAELIFFLAEEKSDFITGQIITCDGGFSL